MRVVCKWLNLALQHNDGTSDLIHVCGGYFCVTGVDLFFGHYIEQLIEGLSSHFLPVSCPWAGFDFFPPHISLQLSSNHQVQRNFSQRTCLHRAREYFLSTCCLSMRLTTIDHVALALLLVWRSNLLLFLLSGPFCSRSPPCRCDHAPVHLNKYIWVYEIS